MDLQHVAVKLFALQPLTDDLDHLGAVFNRWIQAHALPELLIDVADYRHVHHGPGVLLVAHEAHYSLDHALGRWGLLYTRKARVEGGPQAALNQALAAVVTAAHMLEQATTLRFDTHSWQVIVNDRLLAPNTQETYAALQPLLAATFDGLFGAGAPPALAYTGPGRHRLTVNVSAPAAPSLTELARRLAPVAGGFTPPEPAVAPAPDAA
jgi:hypothetical protein